MNLWMSRLSWSASERSEPENFVENEHFMRQFPWFECILSKEKFHLEKLLGGGGARAPCAPPGSYAHDITDVQRMK